MELTVAAEREALRILTGTLKLVRESGSFKQGLWAHPDCKTPACTLGHSVLVENSGLKIVTIKRLTTERQLCIKHTKSESLGSGAAAHVYNIFMHTACWICSSLGTRYIQNFDTHIMARLDIHRRWLLGFRDHRVAMRRLELLIAMKRNRLAALEVEEGEWGRQKKAKDLVTGIQRQQKVKEILQTI